MANSRESTLEAITECPICWEKFEKPKQLPCDHTVCLECLASLAESQRILLCPICRARVLLPSGGVKELPNNLTMIGLLDAMNNANSSKLLCEFCTRRNLREKAEHFCKQCSKYMCVSCASRHKDIAVFGDHETVSVEDHTSICRKHREIFAYRCVTCNNKLLCAYCVHNSKCKDHQMAKFVSDKEKMKEVIKDLKMAVRKYEEMQFAPTELLDKEIKLVIEQREKVMKHMDDLCDEIKLNGKELIERLSKRNDELLEMRREMMSNIKDKASLLSSLTDAAASAMKLGHEHVTSILPNIRIQMSAVMAIDLPTDSITKSLNFKPEKSLSVGKLKLKLNEIGLRKLSMEAFQKKRDEKDREIAEVVKKAKEWQLKQEDQIGDKASVENISNESSSDGDQGELNAENEIQDESDPVFWESSV